MLSDEAVDALLANGPVPPIGRWRRSRKGNLHRWVGDWFVVVFERVNHDWFLGWYSWVVNAPDGSRRFSPTAFRTEAEAIKAVNDELLRLLGRKAG